MTSVSIAEAKAHLSELVTAAYAGSEVVITRRGKPVARLVHVDAGVNNPRQRIDIAALRKHIADLVADGAPVVDSDAALASWRDDVRY